MNYGSGVDDLESPSVGKLRMHECHYAAYMKHQRLFRQCLLHAPLLPPTLDEPAKPQAPRRQTHTFTKPGQTPGQPPKEPEKLPLWSLGLKQVFGGSKRPKPWTLFALSAAKVPNP